MHDSNLKHFDETITKMFVIGLLWCSVMMNLCVVIPGRRVHFDLDIEVPFSRDPCLKANYLYKCITFLHFVGHIELKQTYSQVI